MPLQEFTDFTEADKETDKGAVLVEQGDMDMFGWEQFGGADEEEEEDASKVKMGAIMKLVCLSFV